MKFNLFFNPNLWHHLINRSAPIIFLFGFMKTLLWNQKCLVLILMAVLLTFGMQDTTYGQICQAGMIIEPGKSCTLPNGTDTFSVDASGRGSLEYGFITVEGGIHIRSRKLTLVASKQADGSWEIEEVEGAKPTEIVTEVFDPGSPPIYWTDADTAKIQRANLHGTDVQDLITTGLGWPSAIALDVAGGKMYWTDWRTRNIQRANLDGTDVQDLVTGLDTPTGIALDVAGGKMYWTDWSAQKIQRANLDGTDVQDLVTTGLDWPLAIALDVAGGKMYWIDWGTDKIQCANLDGTNIQDLVTTEYLPAGIALDVAGGKMYWTDRISQKIQRANLDGTDVQDLVTTGPGGPSAITLDVAGGKMYWTYWEDNLTTYAGKIQRANLDGTNIQDIFTGLGEPSGIALGISSPISQDVNRDGSVNILDLVYVGQHYGETGQSPADINGDQVVNIEDLILVAGALGNGVAAPAARSQTLNWLTAEDVKQWLTEAKLSGKKSPAYQRGILMLEHLLAMLAPKETALLPNYPNPFNPETWIPYHLAHAADVMLTIYDTKGVLVHRLDLGYQMAGFYTDRTKAAYWDGRNANGESIASGVYFYQLQAKDYSAIRRMVIVK